MASSLAAAQSDKPALRLLVLASDPAPIQTPTPSKPESTGVNDAAVPALSTPAARRITAAFVGLPIDDTLLQKISAQLTAYYASIGRPFVTIAIPAQDVADGILRVNVLEVRRGRLQVEGNHWFNDQQYLGAIRTRQGDPIDTRSLAADTAWINRDDHKRATIAVEPGDDASTYDLTVRARDSLPLDVTLAADNTGSADTGLYRTGLAVNWTNAFWRGDDLDYDLVSGPDHLGLLENALSYTVYLPWRDWITLSAVDADTSGKPSAPADSSAVHGHTDILSFRYAISLPAPPSFIHHLELGYDFKITNNNLLTGGNAVFPTASDLDQFVLTYTFRDGDTGLAASLVGSPGHLTARNTTAALTSQQPGASPSYVYGRLSVERLTELPLDAVWSARLTAQYSSDNLLPSEQLVFGGIRSIRGFEELGATRDEGLVMQHELRLPQLAAGLFHPDIDMKLLTPFVFLDAGAGRDHLPAAAIPHSWLEMASAGPGMTWQITPNAGLRLSWGFPLLRNGHTGSVLGPQFGVQVTF
jgi:hemolysin activation/secretion protein